MTKIITLLLLVVLLTTNSFSQIQATLTTSATIGTCKDNVFTIAYTPNISGHTIKIKTYVSGVITCGGNAAWPVQVLFGNTNVTMNYNYYNQTDSSWYCNLSNITSTVNLNFNVIVDCNAIDISSNTSPYNLHFVVEDSAQGFDFDLNNGITNSTSFTLNPMQLNIVNQNIQPGVAFLDTTCISFMYKVNSATHADIAFKFEFDANSCSNLSFSNFQYKIGLNGSFNAFIPGDNIAKRY